MVSSEFHRDELAPRRASADIGVTGLAVMGHNLARHGHAVAVHNRSPQRTRALVREHGHEGEFVPAESLKDFVASLKRPRAVIMMVQAGAATDAVIDEFVPLLDDGDIVVDCGNAHFTDTRRRAAVLCPVTIDLDAKDIEVFSTRKEQVIRSYKGEIAGRVHAAHWAQAGTLLVADLLDGRSDGRTHAPGQIDRAVDAVRAAGATGRILFQGDSGYYAGKVAEKIVARGGLFRLGVPRGTALWRAVARVHADDWTDAVDYPEAQVALLDYAPAVWPAGTKVIARRVRYDAAELSADPRSRRSRTVGRDQLALVLDGIEDTAYAYSFIATNQDLDLDEEIAQAEWEFRRRTKIEELFRDTAHGAGLNHLPSGKHAVNSMWMWGALLAYNLSAWLQMLAPIGVARRRIATVRRLLIRRAARWTTTARRHELHFTQGADELIAATLARIRANRHLLSA